MSCYPYSDFWSYLSIWSSWTKTADQSSYFLSKGKFGLRLLLVVLLFKVERNRVANKSLWGERSQSRLPETPSLQVVTVLPMNSSQHSLVKKNYVVHTQEWSIMFQSSRLDWSLLWTPCQAFSLYLFSLSKIFNNCGASLAQGQSLRALGGIRYKPFSCCIIRSSRKPASSKWGALSYLAADAELFQYLTSGMDEPVWLATCQPLCTMMLYSSSYCLC